jgi:hypothetical protein
MAEPENYGKTRNFVETQDKEDFAYFRPWGEKIQTPPRLAALTGRFPT